MSVASQLRALQLSRKITQAFYHGGRLPLKTTNYNRHKTSTGLGLEQFYFSRHEKKKELWLKKTFFKGNSNIFYLGDKLLYVGIESRSEEAKCSDTHPSTLEAEAGGS